MSEHLTKVTCAGCGASLRIPDGLDRLTCSYCGSEMLVRREGGIVALQAVTEGLAGIRSGTDRTAGELALVRLDKEIAEQEASIKVVEQERNAQQSNTAGAGCFTLFFAPFIAAVFGAVPLMAWVTVGIAACFAFYSYGLDRAKPIEARLSEAKARLAALMEERANVRRSLDPGAPKSS